jgi:HD-like signal output (HDOD) protein
MSELRGSELRGLEAWLHSLVEQDLPTFNSVVREICEASKSELSRSDDLSKIILRDANLTSRVLKIANSVHYNTSFEPIKTVSRAIVRLGFDNLQTITLASSLIETFLRGKPQELLIQSMARTFHAAVQAKAMVMHLDNESREQVFIAALLRNIAELALLSTSKEVAVKFISARNRKPEWEKQLSQEHLGTDLQLLNQHLIKDWLLSDIISDVCHERNETSLCVRAVTLGNEISKHIHKGLSHPDVIKLCQQLSSLCNISLEEAKKQVLLKADEASVIAKNFGVEMLLSAMPDPNQIKEKTIEQPKDNDYLFQQQVNHLHKLMLDGENISVVAQSALMCLLEASKIPRTAILFIDYRTKILDVRYVAGKGTHFWRTDVRIGLDQLRKEELIYDFLRVQKPLRYQPEYGEKDLGKLELLGAKGDIFMAPLHHNNKIRAIVYADAIDEKLSARQYEEFQLIVNQINLMIRLNAGLV